MKLPKIPSPTFIRDSEIMKSFKKAISGNVFTTILAKTLVLIAFWFIALVPTWIYLLIRMMVDPVGFWQELSIVIICMLVMGWAQVLLAVAGTFITVAIIIDDKVVKKVIAEGKRAP